MTTRMTRTGDGPSSPAEQVESSLVAGPLDSRLPRLFVHTRVDRLGLAAPVCASEDLGAVVCVGPRFGRSDLVTLTQNFVQSGASTKGLLLDANRYAGKKRSIGTAPMDPSWVRMQTAAGIPHPLTNSGYIPEGRIDILRGVLRKASAMGEHVIAALPLANRFLKQDVDELITEINAAGVAVALMLEHSDDPLGPRANVAGLVKVLTHVDVPVLLLRSDLSIIGALAWGARAGAFGTSTTLRHIFPIAKGGGGGGHIPSISAVVKDTLSLTKLDKINDAIIRMPDPMWSCLCTVCYGRPLDWIATEDEAFTHSLSVIAVMAREIVDDSLSPAKRRALWRGMCHSAQFRAYELDGLTGGAWGEPARFLGSWVAQVDASVQV